MYNGIGLTTPRGSGTNGFVQRNTAFVKRAKERVDYKSEAELRKADDLMFKEPNKEILEHERKRKIELKCAEMEDLMEEEGFGPDEIRRKVANFRKYLAIQDEEQKKQRAEAGAVSGKPVFAAVAKDAETGRPIAKGTHEVMAARLRQAELMREALKIGDTAKGATADPAASAALPYLRSDSDDSDSTDSDAAAAAESKKAAKKAKKDKKDKKKKKKAKRSKKEKRSKEKEKEKKSAGRRERSRSRSPVSRSDKRK